MNPFLEPGEGSLLPFEQERLTKARLRAVSARTPKEWMEIYFEVKELMWKHIERTNPQMHGVVWSNWTTVARPALKRVAATFQAMGLDMSEDMEFAGCEVINGEPHWHTPDSPRISYFWPDGQEVRFEGDEALWSIAFFMWWQNFQISVLDRTRQRVLQEGAVRTLKKGDKDHKAYFDAKRRDIEGGLEPQ
jgi:hypothetical protein